MVDVHADEDKYSDKYVSPVRPSVENLDSLMESAAKIFAPKVTTTCPIKATKPTMYKPLSPDKAAPTPSSSVSVSNTSKEPSKEQAKDEAKRACNLPHAEKDSKPKAKRPFGSIRCRSVRQ